MSYSTCTQHIVNDYLDSDLAKNIQRGQARRAGLVGYTRSPFGCAQAGSKQTSLGGRSQERWPGHDRVHWLLRMLGCVTRPLQSSQKWRKPELARLTLARKMAAINLHISKKGVPFDADHLKLHAA